MIQLLGAHTLGESHCCPILKVEVWGQTVSWQMSVKLVFSSRKIKGMKSEGQTQGTYEFPSNLKSGYLPSLLIALKQLIFSVYFEVYFQNSAGQQKLRLSSAKYFSIIPSRAFKSEGIIRSISVEMSWIFLSHRLEKSQPLSAIELNPFHTLIFYSVLSIFFTVSISYLNDSGRGFLVLALYWFSSQQVPSMKVLSLWVADQYSCYVLRYLNNYFYNFHALSGLPLALNVLARSLTIKKRKGGWERVRQYCLNPLGTYPYQQIMEAKLLMMFSAVSSISVAMSPNTIQQVSQQQLSLNLPPGTSIVKLLISGKNEEQSTLQVPTVAAADRLTFLPNRFHRLLSSLANFFSQGSWILLRSYGFYLQSGNQTGERRIQGLGWKFYLKNC